MATRRLTLGTTQIVHLRSPVVMAQSAASLDELTGGRVTIAPGACTSSHSRVHSLEPLDPAQTLRERIESIRLLLTGEKVSYEDTFVKFKNIGLAWKPVRTTILIYVPATSRTGLRLASRDPKMRAGEPHVRKEDIPKFEEAYARGGMDASRRRTSDAAPAGSVRAVGRVG